MAYATQQDMIDNYTEQELVALTNRAVPSATSIDADVLEQALGEAAAEMDAYLGARYDVSILRAQVPPLSNLVRLNCDIARYRLDADCTREPVIERYKQAIKFLEGVVKGSITLGLGAELTAESTQAAGATSGSVSRVFTQETMRGF